MRSLEDHQAALELLRTAAAVPFTVIAHEVILGRSLMHSATTAIAFAWTEQSPQKSVLRLMEPAPYIPFLELPTDKRAAAP
jgi:hypothetical protein